MQMKIYGFMALGIGSLYGFQQLDKSMHYVETDAKVEKVSYQCTVEGSRKKLVEKDSDKLAYMDCKKAKVAAKHFEYPESAIKRHATITYSWTSPADGSRQSKDHTRRVSSENEYKRGKIIQIFAHKEDPSKTYFN